MQEINIKKKNVLLFFILKRGSLPRVQYTLAGGGCNATAILPTVSDNKKKKMTPLLWISLARREERITRVATPTGTRRLTAVTHVHLVSLWLPCTLRSSPQPGIAWLPSARAPTRHRLSDGQPQHTNNRSTPGAARLIRYGCRSLSQNLLSNCF